MRVRVRVRVRARARVRVWVRVRAWVSVTCLAIMGKAERTRVSVSMVKGSRVLGFKGVRALGCRV